MPEPRRIGPVAPSAIACSAASGATPCVRASQIGFLLSSVSYSSACAGISSTNLSHLSSNPAGMSDASPPTRKYDAVIRAPHTMS